MARSAANIDGVFRHLRGDLLKVERALAANLKSPVPLIPLVGKHITLSGGKRFRPAVLLLSGEACGYTGPRRVVMAVVTEYMHTATLLHDDVVDAGLVRRGKPSANVVFGNSASVLVGDFLFARASQLMTEDGDLDVLGIYARTLVHLTEGEVLQLTKSTNAAITEKEYLRVVFNKTASLIAAASETGAVLAGATPPVRRRMYEYGKASGIAFQLMDDILDYTGSEGELGKRPFQDLREGKITLPLIHALREASAADRRKVVEILGSVAVSDADATAAAGIVEKYGGLAYTARLARQYVARGTTLVAALPPSRARDGLASLAEYIVSRSH